MAVGVVGFADRADHALAGGTAPFLGHALGGVAAPAFDEGVAGEDASLDAAEFVLVEPAFGAAVDFVAVVEHETGAV